MNPNNHTPGSPHTPAEGRPAAAPPGSGAPGNRREPQPEYVEDTSDWFDEEEFSRAEAANKARARNNAGTADEDVGVAEEVLEFEDEAQGGGPRARRAGPESKTFFETLGDGLRSAGETAQRYTHIGVSHAGLERLKFQLKTAHAQLGELAMRCWSDAPEVGLTARDPAIIDAVKRVKFLRHKIREKQAKIADLKKDL